MFAIRAIRAFKVDTRLTSTSTTFNSSSNWIPKMPPKPILYGDLIAPPVRFALMTAKALNIEVEFHKVDLFSGENKLESYIEINPLQKVPALAIGEQVIRDSHAIAVYLCDQAEKQSLYPADVVQRAKVNDLLFFHAAALFPADSKIMCNYFAGNWPADKNDVERWNFLLNYLDKILEKTEWLTGNEITLADICCAATISSLHLLVPPEIDGHIFVKKWLNKLSEVSYFSINTEGLNMLRERIEKMQP